MLINASNHWSGNEDSAGNGRSWQMVCNLTKSRQGGIGVGGMLEGEPRRDGFRHENSLRGVKEHTDATPRFRDPPDAGIPPLTSAPPPHAYRTPSPSGRSK